MKKLMFIAVAALSCVVLAQAPEAQNGNPRRGNFPRGPMMGDRAMMGDPSVMAVMNPKVAERIGLPEETRNQIKKIGEDSRNSIMELQKKTGIAMEKQSKLMQEPKIDEAAVMSAIDELFDCRKEMAKVQTKRIIAIKALLTPEQLEKASGEVKKFREEFTNRHREGGMRRGPREGGEKRPVTDKPAEKPAEAPAAK